MSDSKRASASVRAAIGAALAAGWLVVLSCSSTATVLEADVVPVEEANVSAPAAADAVAESAAAPGAAAASPAAAYLDDPEAVAFGRRYFRAVCTGYCHSTQPGLVRDAPDLFDCDWRHGGTDEEVFRTIAEGVPDTEMLPFGGKLEDEVLWKIVAFLRAGSRCGSG